MSTASYTLGNDGITFVGTSGNIDNWWIWLSNPPDLSRASRVVIETSFAHNTAQIAIGLAVGVSTDFTQRQGEETLTTRLRRYEEYTENVSPSYPCTLTTTYNICDGEVWQQLESYEFAYDLRTEDVAAIRATNTFSSEMWVTDTETITVSSMDVYVWNTPIKRADKRVNAEINYPYTYYFAKNGTVTPYISYDSNMLEVTPDLSNSLYVITPKALWDTSITIWADQSFSNYQYDTLYFHITN